MSILVQAWAFETHVICDTGENYLCAGSSAVANGLASWDAGTCSVGWQVRPNTIAPLLVCKESLFRCKQVEQLRYLYTDYNGGILPHLLPPHCLSLLEWHKSLSLNWLWNYPILYTLQNNVPSLQEVIRQKQGSFLLSVYSTDQLNETTCGWSGGKLPRLFPFSCASKQGRAGSRKKISILTTRHNCPGSASMPGILTAFPGPWHGQSQSLATP